VCLRCRREPEAAPYHDDSDEEDEEEVKGAAEPQPPLRHTVDVSLALTAYANARSYYDLRRLTAQKHEKTIAVSEKACPACTRRLCFAVACVYYVCV
jgi:hypothetical protein